MTTLSPATGTAAGLQLPATFQSVLTAPVQVLNEPPVPVAMMTLVESTTPFGVVTFTKKVSGSDGTVRRPAPSMLAPDGAPGVLQET
jgi:hypothetical protein